MELKNIPPLEDVLKATTPSEDEVVHIKKALTNNGKIGDRYPIGISVLDNAVNGGFKDGDLVLISGKSGEGKTTFAQTITYNLCKIGFPCLWFSFEVTLNELDRKFEQMGIKNFYYTYTPKKLLSGRLDNIKQKIKESKIKYNTKVVFIDHIDFLSPTQQIKAESREILLKMVAMELKTLAIQEEIVIVLLAHLKKTDGDKEPTMEDIGYSGGIYQNADYVLFVMRERLGSAKGLSAEQNSGDLYSNNSIIKYVKNRETGQLKFIKCMLINQRFVEIETFHKE